MSSALRDLSLLCVLVLACDREPPAPAAESPAPRAKAEDAAPTPEPQVVKAEPAPPIAKAEAPVAKAEPAIADAPPTDESFDALVARLVEGLSPTPNPSAAAFVHYRAQEFAKAQPLFALAAREDAVAWKHPFNLACAGARGGDEGVARVALIEAVRRGGKTVVRKAQRDPDLASMRDRDWFLAALADEGAAEVAAEPLPPPEADPVPAIEPAGDLPRGAKSPIAAADLASIAAQLLTVHHAQPKVRGSIAVESIGFAMYEVSRFEACVGARPDDKKARRQCRAELRGNEEEGRPDEMKCTDQFVVHIASLDPLEVGTPVRLTDNTCTMKVRRFEASDLDADGKQEVLLETLGHYYTPEFRVGEQDDWTRMFRVLRLDGTIQLTFDVRWDRHVETISGIAQRLGLRDDDGDGHPDLVIASRDFETQADLEVDDMLWPKADPDVEIELGSLEVVRWTYDATKDAWVDPAPQR